MGTSSATRRNSNTGSHSKSSDGQGADQAAPGLFGIASDLRVDDFELQGLLLGLVGRTHGIFDGDYQPPFQAPAVQELVKRMARLSGADLGNRQQVLEEFQVALEAMQRRSSVASQPSIPTAEVVEKFLESRRPDLAEESFVTHRTILWGFARAFPTLPTDPEVIEHYMAERRDQRKGSPSADYRRLLYSVLTRFYDFAHQRYDALDVMKQIGRPSKGKAKESDYLTLDLLKLLLAAIKDDRLRAYVYLCVGQGLRPEEPLRLDIEDIFPDRLRVKGKERTEWVPLLAEVHEALARIAAGRPGSDPLFVGYTTNRRLGRKQVYNIIHDLFREAGVAGIKAAPKTLRHTFCTLVQSAGCDRAATEALMRHRTSNVTDFYTHLSAEERLGLLRAKLEDFSPLRQANSHLPHLHKSTG